MSDEKKTQNSRKEIEEILNLSADENDLNKVKTTAR